VFMASGLPALRPELNVSSPCRKSFKVSMAPSNVAQSRTFGILRRCFLREPAPCAAAKAEARQAARPRLGTAQDAGAEQLHRYPPVWLQDTEPTLDADKKADQPL
jgi:hypothetical protein